MPAPLKMKKTTTPNLHETDWAQMESEARTIAAELLPALEAPQPVPAMARRRLGAYGTTLRNAVTNWRLDRAGREDLRPLYFIWTTLRTCNFRCTYCDDHQGHKYPDLPNDGVLSTEQGIQLLRVMRTRTPSVYFAGGEPTVRKDLPTLARAAREMNYYPIIINTNGSLVERNLRKPAWRTWLADTDIVIVSLDSLNLETLREMWVYRRPEQVLRNILLLRELSAAMNFKLMVNCVIQPGRIADARDVLNFADKYGIWFCPVPVNIGPHVDQQLMEDPEYARFVAEILRRKRQGTRVSGSLRMNERLLTGAPHSCRNSVKPHIDFNGDLLWPCKATINVPPAHVNVLDFDDVDALYAEASRQIDPTGFYGDGPNQCGAKCNWAQNYTTDTYMHGLRHPASLLAEVAEFLRA